MEVTSSRFPLIYAVSPHIDTESVKVVRAAEPIRRANLNPLCAVLPIPKDGRVWTRSVETTSDLCVDARKMTPDVDGEVVGIGDGYTKTFEICLNYGNVRRGTLTLEAFDLEGRLMELRSRAGDGALVSKTDRMESADSDGDNVIDYDTGFVTVTFARPVDDGEEIWASYETDTKIDPVRMFDVSVVPVSVGDLPKRRIIIGEDESPAKKIFRDVVRAASDQASDGYVMTSDHNDLIDIADAMLKRTMTNTMNYLVLPKDVARDVPLGVRDQYIDVRFLSDDVDVGLGAGIGGAPLEHPMFMIITDLSYAASGRLEKMEYRYHVSSDCVVSFLR